MTEWAICTEALVRRFGKINAVDGLNLEVPKGSVFGFLGRNGAGKTTTIRMLMNMLKPTSGRVEVLGEDPQRAELRERVGYVSDDPVLYGWMKISEITWFVEQFYERWDRKKVVGLIERFDLDPEQKIKHLSKGMNAQLNLALVMGHDPELLILDEPASGLDVLVRRDFLQSIVQVIQDEGRTVFLSSHLVHEVERVADRVAIIDRGKLLVCDEVDVVKQKVKKVLVRVEGDADFSAVDGYRGMQGAGAQRLLTIADYGEGSRKQIEAVGAEVVEVIDLSLEDSFVEYVASGEEN